MHQLSTNAKDPTAREELTQTCIEQGHLGPWAIENQPHPLRTIAILPKQRQAEAAPQVQQLHLSHLSLHGPVTAVLSFMLPTYDSPVRPVGLSIPCHTGLAPK